MNEGRGPGGDAPDPPLLDDELDSGEIWRAIEARIAAWDEPRPHIDVFMHATGIMSVGLGLGPRSVGLTVWPSGEVKMTWVDSSSGPQIRHYRTATPRAVLSMLDDFERRALPAF